MKKFIAGCDSTESGLKRKFILFAGFTAGMRKNEIAYSRPSWFDFKKKRIIVPGFDDFSGFTSKNRRTRYIPLDKTFGKFLLKEYTTWRKEDFMISGDGTESSAFSRYDFRKTFRTLREEVGMPHVTIHAMRHSYCTILATKNNSPESIAEFMGDDVKVIREHYLHYVNQYPKLKHKAFYL